MFSGSFPIFALSNHTTFSLTQTGATVPLIRKTWSYILYVENLLKLSNQCCLKLFMGKTGYNYKKNLTCSALLGMLFVGKN